MVSIDERLPYYVIYVAIIAIGSKLPYNFIMLCINYPVYVRKQDILYL